MHLYEAQVRIKTPSGTSLLIPTRVHAQHPLEAKILLEAQYGKGSVLGSPTKV